MSMVTYITQVVLELPSFTNDKEDFSLAKLKLYHAQIQEKLTRLEKIVALLEQHGFKIIRQKQKLIAYSDKVEAYEIKEALHEANINNHEFSIHLDYTRKWGVL